MKRTVTYNTRILLINILAIKYMFRALLALIVLVNSSCGEECGECFTPPIPFVFELLDDQGENIFTSGAYTEGQLDVISIENNQSFEFRFISEDNRTLIQINDIGWTSEEVNLLFRLNQNEIFTFGVVAQRVSEDCCEFTRYSDITLGGANFEMDDQSGIYSVTVV
ncbi:MAG: hypothetical protein AAGC88_12695 [Bacteroidota bacterium]